MSRKAKEPTIDGWADLPEAEKLTSLATWPKWYQDNYSMKDLRDFFHAYAETVVDEETAAVLKTGTAWISGLDCVIARILSRGYIVPRYVQHLNEKKLPMIESAIREDLDRKWDADVAIGNVVTVVTGTPYRPSIQERVREATGILLGVVDGEIDSFLESKCKKSKFNMAKYLKQNQVKAPHARLMVVYLSGLVAELKDLLSGDDQLVEGYAFLSKTRQQKYYTFLSELLLDTEVWVEGLKKTRKPREKKVKSAEQRVSKMKFLAEFRDLDLTSINPADILGAKQLWAYNTKDRFLFLYVSDYGLNVKGATVQDWAEGKSFKKKLRRPEEILPVVMSAGKVKLKKIMPGIKAKESKVTGRMNGDIVLLRVVK